MSRSEILDLPLGTIRVGPQHRRDMGNLHPLAGSMRENGLMQPIGVTADFVLVFGERRLRAAQILGWDTIAARIVDVPSIVIGEYAENEVRKDFTPSERVAIAEALRLHIGERRGRQAREKVGSGPYFSGTTRDLMAEKAGFSSGKEYERAKSVIARGAPNVIAAMDGGAVSISAAARAVKAAPKEQQMRWTVADIRRAAREAAIGPDPLPTPKEARERSRQTGALVLASDGKYHAFHHAGAGQGRRRLPHAPVRAVAGHPAARSGRRGGLCARAHAQLGDPQGHRAARLVRALHITLWRERHAA